MMMIMLLQLQLQMMSLTPEGHMHLFTLYAIIKATSPMSHIASLVASSNMFCIMLHLFFAVLFAGNKSTTATTDGDDDDDNDDICDDCGHYDEHNDGKNNVDGVSGGGDGQIALRYMPHVCNVNNGSRCIPNRWYGHTIVYIHAQIA